MASPTNDLTINQARPAVIIAALRSGGTYLSHCLSNHPDIFCARGEPLHRHNPWYKMVNGDPAVLVPALLNQTGYDVSMFKISYNQFSSKDIRLQLLEHKPLVINLSRRNTFLQALSLGINSLVRRDKYRKVVSMNKAFHPQHSYNIPTQATVVVEPEKMEKLCQHLENQDSTVRKWLQKREVIHTDLFYEDIVVENGKLSNSEGICDFLQVECFPGKMVTRLKKVNVSPVIENFDEVAHLQEKYGEKPRI